MMGLSEDQVKDTEDSIQKLTNEYIAKVDVLLDVKETDIMKV